MQSADLTECPQLPSQAAAMKLVLGDWSALGDVALTTALRAGLIAAGVLLAGEREHVFRNAIGGALAIETFVLGWAIYKTRTDPAMGKRK